MNRRSFIQRISILGGSFALTFTGVPLKAFSSVKKISGKVQSGGKGLANVLVSDGFSIVKTDKAGKYNIDTNDKSGHVFVIIPSGYAFPVQRDIARFYHPFGATENYDFDLEKLSHNDEQHNFLIWADPQVKNQDDVDQMMATSIPDAQALLKTMNPQTPVHGIGVGDLVWDNHELFAAYDESVAKIGIPFFQCMGNHDMDYGQGGDETADVTFKKLYGPTCFSFNRGKAHYIVLDDVRYLGEDRKYDGFITQEKLDWIAKDLAFVPKDALVIICLHIPVHNGVKNNGELYNLLRDFKNVHIMSGHTHYNVNVIKDNIFEHNHGAVCGAWWTGPICSDGTPRGYGVYEVDGTNLKWYYKPTGLSKEVQLTIYVDELNRQKRLLVNVWNWDPQWKIEYIIDGKPMGAPEMQQGFDPQAVKLYKGENMPATRHFVEPTQTSHLFMAHFEPKVKKVNVVVIDRFGAKYHADWTAG